MILCDCCKNCIILFYAELHSLVSVCMYSKDTSQKNYYIMQIYKKSPVETNGDLIIYRGKQKRHILQIHKGTKCNSSNYYNIKKQFKTMKKTLSRKQICEN